MNDYPKCSHVVDHYSITNRSADFDLDLSYPCSGTSCAVGQCFFTPCYDNWAVCRSTFALRRVNFPSGIIYSNLYRISGDCGTDAIPIGEPLATSNPIRMNSVSGGAAFNLYDFEFPDTWTCIEKNCSYAISVHVSGSLDGQNFIEVGIDDTAPTHDGNFFAIAIGLWKPDDAADTIFYVYGAECWPHHHVELPTILGITLQGDLVIPLQKNILVREKVDP